MKTRIINEIARLASEKYQYDFVLNGTPEDYAVPEEMIDTLRGTISTILTNPLLRESLTPSQIEAINKLDDEAEKAYASLPWDTDASAKDILERSEWTQLRNFAVDCLQEFSVNVHEWEESMT